MVAKEVVVFATLPFFWGFGPVIFSSFVFFAVKLLGSLGGPCPSFGSWFYMVTLSG